VPKNVEENMFEVISITFCEFCSKVRRELVKVKVKNFGFLEQNVANINGGPDQ